MSFIEALERGEIRAASCHNGEWLVHAEVKEGILNLFREGKLQDFPGGFVDKDTIPPRQFHVADGVRIVPGGTAVRRGAYVAKGVIVMPPSYINIGAYVDEGTLVDHHVLVGSCAQIGKHVHLSTGVQIGGVLEPVGARPVIIEDNVFLGAGVIVVEGIRVRKGAVLAPGVVLSKSIPIYDCVNECMIEDGVIPGNVVVVPGTRPSNNVYAKSLGLAMNCALIIKERDNGSNAALALENALREGQ